MDIIQIPTTQTPGAGLGDVVGPASATDNAIVRYDATTGRLLQNSTVTIADSTGAIAGASSLTSPASTNLTLGTTDYGTALTVASATGAATFAGGLTTAAATTLSTGTTPTLTLGSAFAANAAYFKMLGSTLEYNWQLSMSDFVANTFEITPSTAMGGSTFTTPAFKILASTGAATFAGAVTISSSTAGSSGAGALVLQGGISAGNTGSAASYFGGNVTISKASPVVSLINSSNLTTSQFLAQSSTDRSIIVGVFGDISAGTTLGIANAAGSFISTVTVGSNYPDKLVISTQGRAAPIYFGTNNTLALTLDGTTQAATFAGAVTVGGNVGFYNNAPVAKPTGVAVTAAAIHAALVTLNLIAA